MVHFWKFNDKTALQILELRIFISHGEKVEPKLLKIQLLLKNK